MSDPVELNTKVPLRVNVQPQQKGLRLAHWPRPEFFFYRRAVYNLNPCRRVHRRLGEGGGIQSQETGEENGTGRRQ